MRVCRVTGMCVFSVRAAWCVCCVACVYDTRFACTSCGVRACGGLACVMVCVGVCAMGMAGVVRGACVHTRVQTTASRTAVR